MSRLRWIRVIFTGAAVLLSTGVPHLVSAQSTNDPLYLSNATLPPVTTDSGDGYLDKILDEMFARAGSRYELVNLPLARALRSANAGDIDGDAARFEDLSSDFDHLVMVPEPIFHVTFAGLFLSPEIEISTWQDLAGYRIGHVRGWRIFERLFGDHEDKTVVADAETLLGMLQHDRIDVALLTIAPARHLAKEIGMPQPFATKARIRTHLFMYLNEKHADKIDILRDALVSMKTDGTYETIMIGYSAEEE